MAKATKSQWDVFRIKAASQAYVGTVEASDEVEAIERAVSQFNIADALKRRLLARKIR